MKIEVELNEQAEEYARRLAEEYTKGGCATGRDFFWRAIRDALPEPEVAFTVTLPRDEAEAFADGCALRDAYGRGRDAVKRQIREQLSAR